MFKYNPEESIEQFNFRDNEPRLADYRGCSIADPYFQGWQAVFQYVYDVMKGIRVSAKPEKKAVERFINDLARDDLYIDWDDYEIVQVIANSLRHTKGPIAGSAILLLPWMQFHLFNIFALKYSDKTTSPKLPFRVLSDVGKMFKLSAYFLNSYFSNISFFFFN